MTADLSPGALTALTRALVDTDLVLVSVKDGRAIPGQQRQAVLTALRDLGYELRPISEEAP